MDGALPPSLTLFPLYGNVSKAKKNLLIVWGPLLCLFMVLRHGSLMFVVNKA